MIIKTKPKNFESCHSFILLFLLFFCFIKTKNLIFLLFLSFCHHSICYFNKFCYGISYDG